MTLRVLTSIAGPGFSYLEGSVIEVPRLNARHLDWLRRGLVAAVKTPDHATSEVAVAADVHRHAPSARRPRGRHRLVPESSDA